MSSTNVVNFSLRHNKSIERALVFEGMRRVLPHLGTAPRVYVGLGSVWFSDFHLAHRSLGIDRMVSIEIDPIIYKRACFNRPYRTVEVEFGPSETVMPMLLDRPDLAGHAWIVWLDYDQALTEERVSELRRNIEKLPDNSCLVTTFSATPGRYGKPADRVKYLQGLLGPVVDDSITVPQCDGDGLMSVLARTTLDFMRSAAIQAGRPGRFTPAFSLAYKDGTPMVTVGGFLPAKALENEVDSAVEDDTWTGFVAEPIMTPPLTSKEVQTLQACLPSDTPLTRNQVQALGFDLDETSLRSFSAYYSRYASFSQVTT